jgi:hypothetical protein
MSEYATTTVSFTPAEIPWQAMLARLDSYLTNVHQPPSALPAEGKLLVVDAAERRVVRVRSIELPASLPGEPEGMEYWRSFTVEGTFDAATAYVRFSVRDAGSGRSWVDLWLSSRAYHSVHAFDPARREFNPRAKGDLVGLIVEVARAIGAEGFGFRMADEDNLFAPLGLDAIRGYVEVGGKWFQNPLQLLIAGALTSRIDAARFKYDRSDRPMHYRQSGFYIYDIVWPL